MHKVKHSQVTKNKRKNKRFVMSRLSFPRTVYCTVEVALQMLHYTGTVTNEKLFISYINKWQTKKITMVLHSELIRNALHITHKITNFIPRKMMS